MTRPKGFSTIEILVALAVLAILASGAWVWWGQKVQTVSLPLTTTPTETIKPSPSLETTTTPVAVSKPPAIKPGTNCKEGKIAFVRDGNLWTVFPDGTGELQLTEAKTIHGTGESNPDYVEIPGDSANPSWSPDGCLIAFNDRDEGNLWLAQGYQLRKLIASPYALRQGVVTYARPQWSPDGQKIAFQVVGDGYSGLAIANLEGELLHEFYPSDFIAVREFQLISRVYAVAAPGLLVESLSWTKDSKKLLVGVESHHKYEESTHKEEIWELNLSGEKRLLIENGNKPRLSPDGTRLAYVVPTFGSQSTYYSDLGIYNLKSGDIQKITNVGTHPQISAEYIELFWLADNKTVVARFNTLSLLSINIIDTVSKGVTSLGVEDFEKESPALSQDLTLGTAAPDGQHFLVTHEVGRMSNIWKIDKDGLNKEKLTPNASQPAWQPR